MTILKPYEVDLDGKIKRLRRECSTAECGLSYSELLIAMSWLMNGEFQMALHKDRQSYGKCDTFITGSKPPAV